MVGSKADCVDQRKRKSAGTSQRQTRESPRTLRGRVRRARLSDRKKKGKQELYRQHYGGGGSENRGGRNLEEKD